VADNPHIRGLWFFQPPRKGGLTMKKKLITGFVVWVVLFVAFAVFTFMPKNEYSPAHRFSQLYQIRAAGTEIDSIPAFEDAVRSLLERTTPEFRAKNITDVSIGLRLPPDDDLALKKTILFVYPSDGRIHRMEFIEWKPGRKDKHKEEWKDKQDEPFIIFPKDRFMETSF
jgi:hypothetical protein